MSPVDRRYTPVEVLHDDHGTTLTRAVRTADGRPVILKAVDPRHGRPDDVERLKREHDICRTLDPAIVLRPIAFERRHDRPTLVLEDVDGALLDRELGAPMDVERFLRLAIRISSAIAELHRQGVIHKDIKPQSILVERATGAVRLCNLGIATRLPREHTRAGSPRQIAGSLPYMSPEQTGRMNRPVDSRTDLYSLGVTLYQLLTGKLPFQARDPLEWVHCHIARRPPSPREVAPGVPSMIERIVMKLLQKAAEERYQSAWGLRHDLATCLEQWVAHGAIEPFPLGARDIPDRLQIPQKLYGRDAEARTLLRAFDRVVATGAPELVLVSGYSGIGKSSLVHEIEKPIVGERGVFISGKFDQYRRGEPYFTIVQALRDLVREILTESDAVIAGIRQRLQAALGINGQVIVDVIPMVELLIGKQLPVPAMPPAEAQNRFRMVFRQLIAVFARKEHPLALFVDDLQWADSASLALIEDLVTHPEMGHLLVLGAYRDNEVTPAHPMMLMLDEASKAGARISRIVLGPLAEEDVATLLGDVLHCDRADAAPLSTLIHEKTAGNPFFVVQLLGALHEEGLLHLDARAGSWQWDLEKIRAKGSTDNVVDLMVARLYRLPRGTREALITLACLGSRADAATLAIALGGTEADLSAALWEPIREGLVARLGDEYKLLHDRVQEAAYSLVPEDRRASAHLRLGRILLSRMSEEQIEERVFDVVSQLNRGAALITDPAERERLCRLDVLAGTKARASIAYASACVYLTQATALLPGDAWSTRYEDTFRLFMLRAECEYLSGSFEVADALFDEILAEARSNPDRGAVHGMRMRLYQVSGRYDDGVTVALLALRLFGVTIPEGGAALSAAEESEIQAIRTCLEDRRVADIIDAPVATDPDVRAIIRLLVEAAPCAYIGRPRIFPLLALKAVTLSLRHGNIEESCFAYSVYGLMLVSVFMDIQRALDFSEMSLRLNERFGDARLRGTLLHLHGDHINFWRRHIATDFPILEQAFRACLEVGDFVYAGFLAFETVWQLVEKGDRLDDVVEASRRFAAFARQSHNDAVYETIRLEQQLVACLKGATRGPTSFDDDAFDEAACLAVITGATFGCGIVTHRIMKQMTAYIHGRYAEALEAAAAAAEVLGAAMAMPMEATHHFFHALTLAKIHRGAPAGRQREIAATLRDLLRRHAIWAESCPDNFLNRHALVSAEIARLEGRAMDAMRGYERAIRSARENGFVQNEAIACEAAAAFHEESGFGEIADMYLDRARAAYARWGADGKVRQIDRLRPRRPPAGAGAPAATILVQSEQLDLLSVVKASQSISGEMVLDRLVHTLLEVVLEQGGAERGCILVWREGRLRIAAEASSGEDGTVTRILREDPRSSGPIVPPSIIAYVERTRERVIVDDAAGSPRYAADPYVSRARPRSVLCLPIVRQAEVIGALYLENNLVVGAFTPDRLMVLDVIASQAAISLENALLLAGEKRARAAAEEAERRAVFLSGAGEILGQSLHRARVLERLARLVVSGFAEWCVIDLVEGGELRRVAWAHSIPEKEPLLIELGERYPPAWSSPHPSSRAAATAEPVLVPDLTDDLLRSFAVDEGHARLIREIGATTVLVAPLAARGRVLGAIGLGSARPGFHFGSAELDTALELGRRAALAIDNAQLYDEAQAAVRLRDEFMGVAAHELRTPLTSLGLVLHSLRRAIASGRPLEAASVAPAVARAIRQSDRLTALVENLLDVTRIAGGRLPLDLAEMDLGALVREVVERFEADALRAGCPVTVRDGGPVVGRWDRSRLDQVVTNLLANAIKFGAAKPITVTVGAVDGQARLVVADEGIGIDPAQQPRIFERFGRAVSSRHYGGLGLGLYISSRVIDAHGGSISVKSAPGAGTAFTVDLPLDPK